MYSGIKQSTMAKSLLMSESKYNRKENGLSEIKLQEAIKMAKLLDLNEKIIDSGDIEQSPADRIICEAVTLHCGEAVERAYSPVRLI